MATDPARSIESILAALAAQRPPGSATNQAQPSQPPLPYNGTPSQTPQQYPPTVPPGTQIPPYSGAGAYGLPQPTASGSFDLSAIKPVNSGTVSIADAVAQAKAFASEKGISSYDRPPAYPPHDSRAGDARHYRRSRSRSPPRRDAYRDNYNPYRDERRDDRGGYGNDRSESPGRNRGRPSGTFSPRGASGSGRGEDDSEVMEIESSLVGLIIGRQGENLRRVESETGCRVQFLSPGDNPGPYRQCKISGPRAGRAEAKASINRIIEDSGMGAIARAGLDNKPQDGGRGAPKVDPNAPTALREGEECLQIMVPDRTVGLIIGRGGETIRDLQERSGCHINIVGENKSINGLRPVNLIGSRPAAMQAKELILEIVDSDSRNDGAANNRPVKNDRPREVAAGNDRDKINDAIYVPSEAVGMIIGKGGETIREMQTNTGCKINVSQSSGPGEVEREIGLVGTRDAINRAKQAIEDKVDAVRQKNSGGGGRGRPNQNRRDYDNPSHGSQQSGQMQNPAGGQPPAAANGGADPYAMYGGYNAYVALWYQALAQQQQGGGQPGDAPPQPPGA